MWWLSSNETAKEHCSAQCLLWQRTVLNQCLEWVLSHLAQDRKHQWFTATGLPTENIQATLNFPCQAKYIAEVSHSTKTELNEVLQNLPFAVELCFSISVFVEKNPNPVQSIMFAKDTPSPWSKCGHIAQQFKEMWWANPDPYISQVEIKDTQRALCGCSPWGV